jgi:hypothetical protein
MRGLWFLIGRGHSTPFPGYDDIIKDSIYLVDSRPDHIYYRESLLQSLTSYQIQLSGTIHLIVRRQPAVVNGTKR